MLVFLIIGVVFLLGVGVSTQALMFPDVTEFDYELVKNVFYPPYFVIGGEYYKLDDMLNGKKKLVNPNCFIQSLFLIKKLNVLKK